MWMTTILAVNKFKKNAFDLGRGNEWMNAKVVGHNDPALVLRPSMIYCASPLD
jgi:hypothetical protein